MSSTINRRFLDVSLSVLGIVNEPPATPAPVNGTQYIVGSEPAGAFASATANSIARYDGYENKWKFTKPAPGQLEVLNVATKELVSWNGTGWSTTVELAASDGSSSIAKHVKAIVHSGDTLPSTAAVGAKFLNTADSKLYVATAENTWDAGTALAEGDRYVSITDKKIYEYKDSALTGAKPADGVIFLSIGDEVVFGYDATGDKLIVVPGGEVTPPSGTDPVGPIVLPTPSAEFVYTEKHTLTADEATANAFELTYNVVTGKEANVMLAVCGMVQVPGDDFEISGNVVAWTGKGLADIGMEANDIFVVSYPTLG